MHPWYYDRASLDSSKATLKARIKQCKAIARIGHALHLEMKEVKDIVMDMERLLLEDIEFDVEIHSPHRFSLSLLKLLGFDGEEGSGEIVARFANQTYARHAWQFVNASYLCQVSLLYPPPTIALGAVLCALFLLTQTFYSRVSCDMLDCIDAAKDIVTVCIENAPESMEEYVCSLRTLIA
ncbi:hypothetical protein HDU91_002228 [Kappamyces sp. JEL0680]|nr:hypothetical protein HDU91_002228 [Kappamyces sp. JEL0680]